MGVRFARDYGEIIEDLSRAIRRIEGCYSFFHMGDAEWELLRETERSEYIRTMADDIFYGLGCEASIQISGGTIKHDREHHVIKVFHGDIVHIVHLT